MKTMFARAVGAVLATLLVAGQLGCSSRRTTKTVTTEERGGDTVVVTDRDGTVTVPDDRTVTTTETTTEVERDDPDRGLFGIIGNIIALPFRAVGALFRAIF